MKKLFVIFSTIVLAVMSAWAQDNPKLSYQAVVRDNQNRLVVNESVKVDIAVLKGDNTLQYSQYFDNVQTNQNGLLSLVFGGNAGWNDVEWGNSRISVKITLPDNSFVADTTDVTAVPLSINTIHSSSVDPSTIPQSDWNETNTSKCTFIKNKPNISDSVQNYLTSNNYVTETTLDNRRYLTSDSLVITTMQGNITTNATDIATNAANIAANTSKIHSDSIAIMQHVSDTATAIRALITGAHGDVGKLDEKVDSLNKNLFDTLHIKYVTNTVFADTITDVRDSISALRDSMTTNYVSNEDLCDKVMDCDKIKTMRDSIQTNASNIHADSTLFAGRIKNLSDSVKMNVKAIQDSSEHIRDEISDATADLSNLETRFKADSTNLADNYYTKTKINDTLGYYTTTTAMDARHYLTSDSTVITDMQDTLAKHNIRISANYKGIIDTAKAIRESMGTATGDLTSRMSTLHDSIQTNLSSIEALQTHTTKAALCDSVSDCTNALIQSATDSLVSDRELDARHYLTSDSTVITDMQDTLAKHNIRISANYKGIIDTAKAIRESMGTATGDLTSRMSTLHDSIQTNLSSIEALQTHTTKAALCDSVSDCTNALIQSATDSLVSDRELDARHYLTSDSLVITTMQGNIATNTANIATNAAAIAAAVGKEKTDSTTLASRLDALESATMDCGDVKDCIKDTLSYYTPTSGLAAVATSGSYTDLSNTPTIPTTVAELTDASDYAKLAADNTFSGKNIFTDTVTVPSGFAFGTTTTATCGDVAVNACDLLAVFDSLTHRVNDLEELIQRMMDASKPKFDKGALSMLVADGSVTITAPLLTGAGDPELSAEICSFTDSACTNMEGCTSAALSGADIVGTFASLSCGTHYIRAVATNSKGSDTAYFKAFVLVGQIVCDQASSGKIYTCGATTVSADYHFSSTCAEGDPSDYKYEWTVDGMTQSSTTPDMTVEFILAKEYEIACTATHKTNSAYKIKASVKHTLTNSGAVTPELVVGTDDVHGTAKVVYYNNANTIKWYNANDSLVLTGLACSDTGSYKVTAVSSTGCKATKNVKVRKVVTYCELAAEPTLTTEFAHYDETAGKWLLDSVADIEGNKYLVVQIGSQCWMRQNMKSKTLPKSGEVMSPITADGGSSSYTSPKCFINLTADKGCADFYEKYGVLYNWAAAMDTSNSSTSAQPTLPRRGICPEGWHVPSDAEFTTLCTSALAAVPGSPTPSPAFSTQTNQYEGTNTRIATVLAGGHDWKYDKSKADNTGCDYEDEYRDAVHFSALPARGWYSGSFYAVTETAYFWTATQTSSTAAWYRYVTYANAGVGRYYNSKAALARSVRCVRD